MQVEDGGRGICSCYCLEMQAESGPSTELEGWHYLPRDPQMEKLVQCLQANIPLAKVSHVAAKKAGKRA